MAGSVRLTPSAMAERRQRNAIWRTRQREDAFALLKTKKYVENVHSAIDSLVKGYEKQIDTQSGAETVVPLDRTRVQALSKAAELSLRLLGKVLPDVKAVEIENTSAEQDPRQLPTADLMALIEKLGEKDPIDLPEADYVEVPVPETGKTSTSDPGW